MLQITEVSKATFSIELSAPRDPNDEVRFLEFLNGVTEKESFGLILNVDGEKAFSPEAKKQLNVWFKTHRDALKERCFGFARVSPEATEESAFNSAALKKAIPCPYEVFASKIEAVSWLGSQATADAQA